MTGLALVGKPLGNKMWLGDNASGRQTANIINFQVTTLQAALRPQISNLATLLKGIIAQSLESDELRQIYSQIYSHILVLQITSCVITGQFSSLSLNFIIYEKKR